MATANQLLYDAAVRHQIRLLHFTKGEADWIGKLLRESDKELAGMLAKGLTDFGSARTARLLEDVRKVRGAVFDDVKGHLTGQLQGLAVSEAAFESGAIISSVGFNLELTRVDPATLKALAGKPIQGLTLDGWVDSISANDMNRLAQQVGLGMVAGETTDDIVRRVVGTRAANYSDGVLAVTRRNAESLVRTSVNSVSNAAREEVWSANEDIIEGLRWVATLDGRTTPVCQARDGEVFPVKEGPRPPAHFGCRSLMVAVIDGIAAVGDRPTVMDTRTRKQREVDFRAEAKAEAGDGWKEMSPEERQAAIKARRTAWAKERVGTIPAETTYDSWLSTQPKEFQDEVLGPTRAKLFREGMSLDSFVNEQGKRLTLAELKALDQGDVLNVAQPSIGLKAKALLQQGMDSDNVLAAIKAEFPEANTTAASIASYKSELKKAGLLNADKPFMPASTAASAKATDTHKLLGHFEDSLPPGVKHHLAGGWAQVVQDLEGYPGTYGHYKAGQGVVLSANKLATISQTQAQQVIAHELGHLLQKQHGVTLSSWGLNDMKIQASQLSAAGKKAYAYYLAHTDELMAELIAQVLSPSPMTSQGLSAIEFRQIFGKYLDATKDVLANKFPIPPVGVPSVAGHPPMTPASVAGKHTSVGSYAKALIQQGYGTDEVLAAVKMEFPNAKTSASSIATYKSELKKAGLLSTNGVGPTVKTVPTTAPVTPQIPKLLGESLSSIESSALTEYQAAVLKGSNQAALDKITKFWFSTNKQSQQLAQELIELAKWNVSKGIVGNQTVAAATTPAIKVNAPKKPPKLVGKTLVGYEQKALVDFQAALLQNATDAQLDAIIKLYWGTNAAWAQKAAKNVIDLAKWNVSQGLVGPSAGSAVPKLAGVKLGGYSQNGLWKLEQAILQQATAESELIPILQAHFGSSFDLAKGKDLIELAKWNVAHGKVSSIAASAAAKATYVNALTPVDLTPSRIAATPREGLPPPPRFTSEQHKYALQKYLGVDATSADKTHLTTLNAAQRKAGLPELTLEEITAIRAYTGSHYMTLNTALRTAQYSGSLELQACVDAAQSGLNKMPKYTGITRRGVGRMSADAYEAFQKVYVPGTIIEENAFISSSPTRPWSGATQMEIRSKTGVHIKNVSRYRGEDEVLFPPGVKLKVISVEVKNGVTHILLEEV